MTKMEIGYRLKQARVAANLTPQQLSEKVEIPTWLLGLWENGKRLPELDLAFKLLDICGHTIENVFAQTSCDTQTPSKTYNVADKSNTTSFYGTLAVWVFALSGGTWVGRNYRLIVLRYEYFLGLLH